MSTDRGVEESFNATEREWFRVVDPSSRNRPLRQYSVDWEVITIILEKHRIQRRARSHEVYLPVAIHDVRHPVGRLPPAHRYGFATVRQKRSSKALQVYTCCFVYLSCSFPRDQGNQGGMERLYENEIGPQDQVLLRISIRAWPWKNTRGFQSRCLCMRGFGTAGPVSGRQMEVLNVDDTVPIS